MHYIPILKGKKAEYDALAELDTKLKSRFTPLFEVAAIPLDKTKKPRRTLDEHTEFLADTLKESWGTDYRFLVDGITLSINSEASDESHSLVSLGKLSKAKGLKLVPVTSLYRDDDYQAAVKEVAAICKEGICFRLNGADIADPDAGIEEEINNFLKQFDITPDNIDLILDFGEIPRNVDERIMALAIRSAIMAVPSIEKWRSFTIAASAFPEQLSKDLGFASGEISTAPRTEWRIWRYLLSQADALPRMPSFGDYGVSNPKPVEFDPVRMSMAAKIRYTSENHWLIVKGKSTKIEGYDQYFNLAEELINHPEFRGEKFSPGDAYIHSRGVRAKDATCGSQATWIQAGISHHLAFVLHQLSSSSAV